MKRVGSSQIMNNVVAVARRVLNNVLMSRSTQRYRIISRAYGLVIAFVIVIIGSVKIITARVIAITVVNQIVA